MAEAAVRHIDDAGSLLDRSAVPRWLMRSILAGASIYFLSAFFATLVLYIDRPHVFLTFAAPQLPLVAVMVLGAIAVLKPRRGVARVALLFLLTLPVGWIAIAVIGLNERLPAGAYWTLPASFRAGDPAAASRRSTRGSADASRRALAGARRPS